MTLEENLNKHRLALPELSKAGGSYESLNIRGNIAYVAIQFPILNGACLYQGRIGKDLSTKEGYQAMELCALNVLSHVKHHIGFENLEGLNHIDAYYQAAEGWDDAPLVVNGASDLFLKVLEDKGKHSRAIVGAHQLARNFSVGLCASFTLK